MRKFVLAAALLLTCIVAATPAGAQGYPRAVQRVLSQARAASGGAGWNYLRGWHEAGVQGGVPYEAWLDPLRMGLRVEAHEAAGVRTHGFNGQGAWQIAPGGAASGTGDPGPVAQARSEAFFGVYGFFYPGRFDAAGKLMGVRRRQGKAYDVVDIQPWRGTPRELWFDQRTHLLARMVDRSGPKPVAVDLSDYRKVGPLLLAFRFTADGGDPADPRNRALESLVFTRADRDLFSLPRARAPGG